MNEVQHQEARYIRSRTGRFWKILGGVLFVLALLTPLLTWIFWPEISAWKLKNDQKALVAQLEETDVSSIQGCIRNTDRQQ